MRTVRGWNAGEPGAATARVVHLAGIAQGIALLTFPAASTIFTTRYGLSRSAYGARFLPQALTAITSPAASPAARRYPGPGPVSCGS